MMWRLAIMVLFFSACSSKERSPVEVLVSIQQLQSEMQKPFAQSLMIWNSSVQVEISNCKDLTTFLKIESTTHTKHNAQDSLEWSDWASTVGGKCMLWLTIQNAQAPKKIEWSPDHLAQNIYAHLDLSSFNSSLGPRIKGTPKKHFPSLSLQNPVFTPHGFSIESESFGYSLDLIALGDFDRNGQDDALVYWQDRAKAGSYNAASVLILAPPNEQGAILAHKIELSVLAQYFR